MNIGVLGTGIVGSTIAGKLATLGHHVRMGARDAKNEKAAAWARGAGKRASQGTFADTAAFGEMLFNCTSGAGSLEALQAAGAEALRGKVLVDVANPLDFSKGMPPRLLVCNDESLGEQIQKAFPETRVVKALNTVSAAVMVNPGSIAGGDHDLFIAGNDGGAKAQVAEILQNWFGWKTVHDVGDITAARGTEAYLLLWVRLYGSFNSPSFNIKVIRGG
jgi:predicted dinucleotide-binding enzyme